MKKWVILLTVCLSSSMLFAQTAFSPEQHKTVCSERSDGRYLSTYGVVHAMLKDTKPLYASDMISPGKNLPNGKKRYGQP